MTDDKEIKYSSYTPAQKKATQKYRTNNRDKVNEQRKKYYQKRKESDPNFLAYKRQKAKEYYQRKKSIKDNKPEVVEEKPIEPIIEEPKIAVDETKEDKPKKVNKSIKKKDSKEMIDKMNIVANALRETIKEEKKEAIKDETPIIEEKKKIIRKSKKKE